MATGLAEAVVKAGADVRYDAAVTRILRAGDGAVRGVELPGGERIAADAVVCNADLPVAYRTLLGGVEAPAGRPPRSLLAVVPAVGRRRARRAAAWCGTPQHPLRRAVGRVVPGADPRRRRDAGPVDPRDAALPRRRVARPARLLDAVRPRAGAQPRRPRRLDAATARGPSSACAGRSPRPATRRTWSPRRSTTRWTGRRWAWSGARRSPSPTPSARPARSVRATSIRRVPGLVFVGSSTVPGVGVPMVLVSGKLAAARVRDLAR